MVNAAAAAVVSGSDVMNEAGHGVGEVLAGVVAELLFEPPEQAGRDDRHQRDEHEQGYRVGHVDLGAVSTGCGHLEQDHGGE